MMRVLLSRWSTLIHAVTGMWVQTWVCVRLGARVQLNARRECGDPWRTPAACEVRLERVVQGHVGRMQCLAVLRAVRMVAAGCAHVTCCG